MDRHISRRTLLRSTLGSTLGSTLVAASALSASSCTTPSGDPDAITIGYVPIACSAPLLIADATGAFARLGLTVTLRAFAGWSDLWTAYATEEINVAHMLSPMTVAADSGATGATRATELAFMQNTNGQAITLAARHHGHIHEPADFRGMVLGIPFEYSVHALLLRDYLDSHGVDPTRDVELRLLRPADMVAQLTVGGIDGFIGPEPFNQRSVASGAGRIWALTRQLWNNHPCCSIAMAKDWSSAHPEQARSIVVALKHAAQQLNDPQEIPTTAHALSQQKYLNQPAELLSAVLAGKYKDWDGNSHTDPQRINYGKPTTAAAVTWMAAQLARWNLGGTSITVDDRSIISAAQSVLPPGIHNSTDPITVNNFTFNPLAPTAGFAHSLPRKTGF